MKHILRKKLGSENFKTVQAYDYEGFCSDCLVGGCWINCDNSCVAAGQNSNCIGNCWGMCLGYCEGECRGTSKGY